MTTCAGNQRNLFAVRGEEGRYWDIAPVLGLAEPGVSRGIATADVDGDGRLGLRGREPVGGLVLLPEREPRLWEHSSGSICCCPSTPEDWGRLDPGPGTPAGTSRADRPWRDRERRAARRPAARRCCRRRQRPFWEAEPRPALWTGPNPPATPLRVAFHWRDPRGRAQRETLELVPGWHTILLGRTTADVD